MDERPTDTGPDNRLTRRRGGRVVTALAVAGVQRPDNAGPDGDDCPEKDGRQSQGSAQI